MMLPQVDPARRGVAQRRQLACPQALTRGPTRPADAADAPFFGPLELVWSYGPLTQLAVVRPQLHQADIGHGASAALGVRVDQALE